ncbi:MULTISPECIES: Hsp33 family molecular chaperone HslO [unclassified Prochlorococcus]|uniref:Hsp33 family molecular chaperone HslO n=1 Tax=unclassified Prochlorococcus TaxID=2627481 RepID=UPI0005336EC4|nr:MULTISPECIES: Hsp33 family molecular chaperone HslO [unclassified Prochlorococcus]KGG15352.1 Chaperonin (heat shock protein 33) [Prochlorococcus sp. MIT 0602]KGG17630.1 Chaperonin (heat shock protein 33) [Prochlorococcus sp. MIT 0603]
MNDLLVRATAANGAIRLVAVTTTETTKEARRRHSLSHLTTALLGRAMGSALILASSMKVKHGRVTVKIQSDGPINGLFVDAGRDGTVRGYLGNPDLELDLILTKTKKHYFDFQTATGRGYLNVTRDNGKGEPFSSTVELVNGCIGEDIASYLFQSEQTKSAVFVGEKISNGELVCSGALIAQVLPKEVDNDSLLDFVNKECFNIDNFSEELYRCKNNLPNLFNSLFPKLNPYVIKDRDNFQNISFKCRCSRSRSISALKLLGKKEILDILNTEKESKLTCKFCNTVYSIDEKELMRISDEIG